MSGLGVVSVDELATEIEKHHDSDLLRCQIADLRAKRIDLKKFCSNVRMMCGAQVLLDTVNGLQNKQKEKLGTKSVGANGSVSHLHSCPVIDPPSMRPEPRLTVLPAESRVPESRVPESRVALPMEKRTELPKPPLVAPKFTAPPDVSNTMPPPTLLPHPDLLLRRGGTFVAGSRVGEATAPPAPPPPTKPSSSVSQDGSKTLVHALLCSRESCEMSGCWTTKMLLQRVKEHATSCAFANLPGGQGDCTTCKKWHQLERLKEHYRRKLTNTQKQARILAIA